MADHSYAATVNSLVSSITVAELAQILFHDPNAPLKTVPQAVFNALPANVQRHFFKLGPN